MDGVKGEGAKKAGGWPWGKLGGRHANDTTDQLRGQGVSGFYCFPPLPTQFPRLPRPDPPRRQTRTVYFLYMIQILCLNKRLVKG